MHTLSANVDLAFSGTSLGSGAGEPKRQKSSMDSKQRFTEVRLFLCNSHQCCAGGDRGVSESTCFVMFPQVFSVNNVNVVIRTRTEHLTDEEKARIKSKLRVVFTFLLLYWKVHFLMFRWKKHFRVSSWYRGAAHKRTRGKIYIHLSGLNVFQSANSLGMLL